MLFGNSKERSMFAFNCIRGLRIQTTSNLPSLLRAEYADWLLALLQAQVWSHCVISRCGQGLKD